MLIEKCLLSMDAWLYPINLGSMSVCQNICVYRLYDFPKYDFGMLTPDSSLHCLLVPGLAPIR